MMIPMGLFSSTLSCKDMAHFSNELRVMYSSGVPMNRIMRVLGEKSGSQRLRRLCTRMHHHLDAGATFAQAIEFEGKHFTIFARTLILVGERCGQLEPVFDILKQYYEEFHKLQQALLKQVIYPCCIIVAAGLIIPIFKFVMIGGGDAMSENEFYLHIFGMVFSFFFGIIMNLFLLAGLYRLVTQVSSIESILMRFWPFHKIVRNVLFARFGWSLAFISHIGLSLEQGLMVAAQSTGSYQLRKDMERCVKALKQQATLSEAISQSALLPPDIQAHIQVGEESGKLDEVFEYIGKQCFALAFHKMKILVSCIELIFILSLGYFIASGRLDYLIAVVLSLGGLLN